MSQKDYVRCWALDAANGQITTHRWLPFGLYPGKRYMKSLLAPAA